MRLVSTIMKQRICEIVLVATKFLFLQVYGGVLSNFRFSDTRLPLENDANYFKCFHLEDLHIYFVLSFIFPEMLLLSLFFVA